MSWKNQLTDRAAIKIANGIARLQLGFTTFMNKRTRQFSKRTWIVLMILFAAGWGALSLYFIISAIENKQQNSFKSNKIQFIVKPARNDSLMLLEEIYKQRHKK